MAYVIKSIDDTVDKKFLVAKTLKGQTTLGSIIHIMDAEEKSNGIIKIDYRVTDQGEQYSFRDYTIKFEDIKQFCKWARPDNFIARHYHEFNIKDVQHYVKVSNRSFASFCFPIIIVVLLAVWIVALFSIKGATGAMVAFISSLVALIAITAGFKKHKSNAKMRLYHKVSTNWDVVIK